MILLQFFQANNLFLHQSYLKNPPPSQINLIKNAKNYFLLVNKLKNSESAQLCEPSPINKPINAKKVT